ncbi:DUF3857 domain-containing protein [Winogradskyella echinorum]|uniref:DUF3857 domain-containing protein n=1 Tax=Winogradskyella echinorum TaxID=538189 RepID=A0ABR6Y425_9FLAO|nr:DUF3858 domain-containing protein [Winogradskyella echinorum]MBC3847472.1 DUF3857 domain-containing protein [Winogradskyella echinorum]MBC5751820.1 DUF3857 domain-containing protein [Winogradskyella echinorum]
MRYFIILVTLLLINTITGQNIEFGSVSIEELQENYYSQDSSAHAAILYLKETIDFEHNQTSGLKQKRDVHVRIKIYDKEGFEWATRKVTLFETRSRGEKLVDLTGSTYNYVNGAIKIENLKDDGIFEENMSKYFKAISFTFPNVQKGSIIEYKYSIISPYLAIDEVALQYSIPIKKLDVLISKPKTYKYNTVLNPKSHFQPKLKYLDYSENKGMQVNYDRVIKILENDVPSLETEPFSGNVNNYRAKLNFELSGTLTQYGTVSRDFSASWEKISKTISESSRFGLESEKKGFYKKDLNELLGDTVDELKVTNLVENYVKSKVKWNNQYGKYTQKGIREAYKQGEGNVADINLLVVSMLRSRGIDANPVLVSTRNNGVPLFPTKNGFNYVICMVKIGSNHLFIDATEPHAINNLLPKRVLNWQGLVVLEEGSNKWVDLIANNNSIDATALNIKIEDDYSVSGKVRKNMTFYRALDYRKKYFNHTNEEHIKSLESNKGDIEISELNYESGNDNSQPVKVTYNYKLSDGVDEIGDKLYFSPLLFLAIKESPFKLEERKYPIDFVIPFADKYKINIMLPEGYKVESLPENRGMEFKAGEAKFTYIAKENGKYLQLSVQLEINNPLILPADYKDFKDFYSKIVEKQAEQIVLTKA